MSWADRIDAQIIIFTISIKTKFYNDFWKKKRVKIDVLEYFSNVFTTILTFQRPPKLADWSQSLQKTFRNNESK